MRPGRIPFGGLPVSARIYILTVALAGLCVIAARAASAEFTYDLEQLILIALAIALGPQTVKLGMKVEMSAALPFIFAALMRHGLNAAIDVSFLGVLSSCVLRRHPFEPHRTIFNVSSIVLTTWITGRLYLGLSGLPERLAPGDFAPGQFLLPLITAVLTYYFVNTLTVAAAVGLSRGLSIPRLWHDSFLWTFLSYFSGGSLAVGMVYLLRTFGVDSLLLALPPVMLLQYSYRLYLDRMEERKQRIETVEKHNLELEQKVERRTRQLQEANQRLLESNEELQRAYRLKSEFLANMSHELRTPLNAIIGFSELLEEGSYGPLLGEQREFVGDIHESGKHLLSLINSILDLSKIEAGRMTLDRVDFPLPATIRDCLNVVRPLALKKEISLECDLSGAPPMAWADIGMTRQMMYNLLSNAVKFTPAGGRVAVSCRVNGHDLILSVEDSGIGIPVEDQDRIFTEFYQVDGSYARRYQGTGLGLALSRRLAELHGGTIRVESAPGKGSTFTATIPHAVRSGGAEGTPGSSRTPRDSRAWKGPKGARGRILVVEDNAANLKLARSLLASGGFEVLEASGGEEAFDRLSGTLPDLILMDLQLPGTDGLDLTRRIKGDPRTAAIPTIALTAHVMKGDEERAIEAGCAGYIPKPIDAARFCDQVDSFLRGPDGSGEAAETAGAVTHNGETDE